MTVQRRTSIRLTSHHQTRVARSLGLPAHNGNDPLTSQHLSATRRRAGEGAYIAVYGGGFWGAWLADRVEFCSRRPSLVLAYAKASYRS